MREGAEEKLMPARNRLNEAIKEVHNEDAFVPIQLLWRTISAIAESMKLLENAFVAEREEREQTKG
jgi:hypothetical protein